MGAHGRGNLRIWCHIRQVYGIMIAEVLDHAPHRKGLHDESQPGCPAAEGLPVLDFFDRLVPSEADQLVHSGGEEDLRRALELEPARADAALALGAAPAWARGGRAGGRAAGQGHGNFEAEGLAARIRLARDADEPLTEALEAFDSGDREEGIELLLAALDGSEDGQREDIRKAIVGALNELGTDDPRARDYRRRLAAAIY